MRKKLRRYVTYSRSKKSAKERVLQFTHRHPFSIPLMTFGVLLVVTAIGFGVSALNKADTSPSPSARIVILSYDHQEQTVPSDQPTVGALIKKLAIPINEGDVVEPSQATRINQNDFRINIYRAVPVKINDGSNTIYTSSAATTPRSIATQAAVSLYPEDSLKTEPTTNFLRDYSIGETVNIDRSVPVALNIYGAAVPTRTHAKTVKELLAEKRIKISKIDTIQPALNTPISADIAVAVIRNGIRTISEIHNIPMPVQTLNDPTLAYGTTATRQTGSPGKESVTYEVNVQGGKEVSRKALQRVVVVQPVTQIVVQGINLGGIKGDMAYAGIAPSDYAYADYIISHESGWCPTKAQGQYGSCPAYSGSVPSYGGYGLCQSTPGSKMATAGADWATNPVTQLRWCNGYAVSRHGGWYGAYNYWLAHHNW